MGHTTRMSQGPFSKLALILLHYTVCIFQCKFSLSTTLFLMGPNLYCKFSFTSYCWPQAWACPPPMLFFPRKTGCEMSQPPTNSIPSSCFTQSQVIWVSEVMLIFPREMIEGKHTVNMGLLPSLQCPVDPCSEISKRLVWGTETSVLCIYS